MYKVQLVAKGFIQEYGIDYEEKFALVSRLFFVHALLVAVASHYWSLFQVNVKTAFLNGNLREEVYMQPPLRLSHLPNKVCHLH